MKSEFERLKKEIENKNELLVELNEKKKEYEEIIFTDVN